MISRNVVILTESEFDEHVRAAFLRGVARGKFEESYARTNSQPPGSNGVSEGAAVRTANVEHGSTRRPANFTSISE